MSSAVPEIYQHDHFEARRQVFRLFGAGFTLVSLDGRILAASEQKAFRLKEDIRVHDGPGGPEILRITANKMIDFSAAYHVIDSLTNEHIGTLRRKGWSSLFRDSWEILDAQGVVRGKISEDSPWKAIIRRTIEIASMLLPQAFHVEVDGQVVGIMQQNFNIFVHKYQVDLSHDTEQLLPRPLAVATVILLLAIEGRQT